MLFPHVQSSHPHTPLGGTGDVIPLSKHLMTTAYFHRQIDKVVGRWLGAFGFSAPSSMLIARFRTLIIEHLMESHGEVSAAEDAETGDMNMALEEAALGVLSAWGNYILPDQDIVLDRKQGFSALRLAFLRANISGTYSDIFLGDDVGDLPEVLRRMTIQPRPALVPLKMNRQEI